ncbi:MAG: AbrB/MazE/SpoVT family DNA-binding domain-containing protein [Candidatus Micrarchaeaceae archaeon]
MYKLNNKLVVSLPYDVIETLGVHDGDEIDFFKYSDKSFIFAKKNYIASLLTKGMAPSKAAAQAQGQEQEQVAKVVELGEGELELLKKLDTLRYNERTVSNVNSILNGSEKEVLQRLIKKGFVEPFKKPGEQQYKYSIPKGIYDRFLFGKREKKMPSGERAAPTIEKSAKGWEDKLMSSNYMELLESKGYIVLSSEAEAANVSAALEDSIKQGLVVGTRAFNKKFYIALRGFINKYAPKIVKLIEQKPLGSAEIAQKIGIDPEGVRAVMYYMAEAGDVTEVRKDIFKAT